MSGRSESTSPLQVLKQFAAVCGEELKPLEDLLGRFNTFDVLRSTYTEIRHSNVLAWLLDPRENHGLGDYFLRIWLTDFLTQKKNQARGFSPRLLSDADFSRAEVLREWEHVDLLIRIPCRTGRELVFCVENKVNALQRVGQLPDYKAVVLRHFPNASLCRFIFLTKNEEKAEDPDFIEVTYARVLQVLKQCVQEKGADLPGRASQLINDYLQILESRFMKSSPERELAQSIYRKHHKALDLIFEHLPDQRMDLAESLGVLLQKNAKKLGLVPLRIDRGLVRFAPREWWDIAVNRAIDADDWCHVFCQIEVCGRTPALIATADASRGEAKKLSAAAKRNHFPNTGNETADTKWRTFYRVQGKGILLKSVDSDGQEELVQRMWAWVRKELSGESFQSMRKAVTPILLSPNRRKS